jgi:hypothetical protein
MNALEMNQGQKTFAPNSKSDSFLGKEKTKKTYSPFSNKNGQRISGQDNTLVPDKHDTSCRRCFCE